MEGGFQVKTGQGNGIDMSPSKLTSILARGEYSRHQFKRNATNSDGLAVELAAFAKSDGGWLLLGADDYGGIAGLKAADVRRRNLFLANAASQHVRPLAQPEVLPDSLGRGAPEGQAGKEGGTAW